MRSLMCPIEMTLTKQCKYECAEDFFSRNSITLVLPDNCICLYYKNSRNMDSARLALLQAFDNDFGNTWEQRCEHKGTCPISLNSDSHMYYLYEFCETDCAIGEIGFQRQAYYEEMSSDYRDPCKIFSGVNIFYTNQDPYIGAFNHFHIILMLCNY